MASKVTRHMLREYYGIPAQGGGMAYHYINPGFTQLNETGGAKLETTAFIGDKNASPVVTGYENQFSFETQYVSGDPVVEDVRRIAVNQLVGADCERELISIDLSEPADGVTGGYRARRFRIVVAAAPPQGEPRGVAKLAGAFHQSGDLETGVFVPESKTFTADA